MPQMPDETARDWFRRVGQEWQEADDAFQVEEDRIDAEAKQRGEVFGVQDAAWSAAAQRLEDLTKEQEDAGEAVARQIRLES